MQAGTTTSIAHWATRATTGVLRQHLAVDRDALARPGLDAELGGVELAGRRGGGPEA